MVVRGAGKGDQKRRFARDGELCDGPCACTGQDQVGGGELLVDPGEKSAHIRLYPGFQVAAQDDIEILLARLVNPPKSRPCIFQFLQSSAHRHV